MGIRLTLLDVLIVTAEQGQCHGDENKVLWENRCCCSKCVIITLSLPNIEQLLEEMWLLLMSPAQWGQTPKAPEGHSCPS